MNAPNAASRRPPIAEMALVLGVPLLTILAGAITLALAAQSGFTPLPEPPAASAPAR